MAKFLGLSALSVMFRRVISRSITSTASATASATANAAVNSITLPSGQTIKVVDWDDDREGLHWGVCWVPFPYRPEGITTRDLSNMKSAYNMFPLANSQGTPRTAIKKFHWSGGLNPGTSSIFASYFSSLAFAKAYRRVR